MSIPIQTSAPRVSADDLSSTFPRIQQRRKAMNLAVKFARLIQGEDDDIVREAISLVYPDEHLDALQALRTLIATHAAIAASRGEIKPSAEASQSEADKDPESVVA